MADPGLAKSRPDSPIRARSSTDWLARGKWTRQSPKTPGVSAFSLQSTGVNPTKMRASRLTEGQLTQYGNDGFLVVAEPILAEDGVAFVGERVDRLYARWRTLPHRLAPGPSREMLPSIARVHQLSALDPALAHCQLFEACRGIAASILGKRQVWCRFAGSVYKLPGAGNVEWHQDFAKSTLGTPKHSVHFWIPLNDHPGNAGTLMFVPGSHLDTPAKRRHGTRSVGHSGSASAEITAGVPLAVGNFSIHTPFTKHGSNPNRSDQTRKALVLEFSPGAWSAARQFGSALAAMFLSRGERAT
jgi:hypothetical protein